jgi:hypothetical protein
MSLRSVILWVLAGCLLCFAASASAAEPTTDDGAAPAVDSATLGTLLAQHKGPVIWQYDDETRQAMDNDMELWRMYNLAMAARNRRKAIGMATFIPGAVMVAVGFIGGLFQTAIGLYNQKVGDILLVAGVAGGLPLVGVGIYFTGAKSQAEKDYEQYVIQKYKVAPILRLVPTPHKGMMACIGAKF